MSPALAPHRFDSARKEISFAFERVPFMRKHLEAAGVRLEELKTPEDLERMPPTRKADYRRNFPAGVLASGQVLHQPGVLQMKSSGTESERLVTAVRSLDLARRMMGCLDVNPGFGFLLKTRSVKSVRFAAPNCSDVECANPHSTYEDRLLPDGTVVLPVYHDLLTTPSTLLDTGARDWSRHDPHFVYADATHLALLSRHQGERPLGANPPKGIALSFSLPTQANRRELRRRWPEVPIAEVVAMSEFGWLAMECPRERLHLNSDAYYLEALFPDEPCRQSGMFELVVTSLGDSLAPHIRYATGDLYSRGDSCACGHRFPAVRAEGRRASVLTLPDGTLLSPRALDESVGDLAGLRLYQLVQEDAARFSFRYLADGPVAVASLEERLFQRLPKQVSLTVEEVQYLPAERSGKFLTCKRAEGLSERPGGGTLG